MSGDSQRELMLKFIIRFIEEHGYPPTVRDIKEGMNYRTTSAPYAHLMKLDEEGKIVYTRGVARGIRVIQ